MTSASLDTPSISAIAERSLALAASAFRSSASCCSWACLADFALSQPAQSSRIVLAPPAARRPSVGHFLRALDVLPRALHDALCSPQSVQKRWPYRRFLERSLSEFLRVERRFVDTFKLKRPFLSPCTFSFAVSSTAKKSGRPVSSATRSSALVSTVFCFFI